MDGWMAKQKLLTSSQIFWCVYQFLKKNWISIYLKIKMLGVQVCPTLWIPSCSVHRIFQAGLLEWVVIPFSRWSSWPRDGTLISNTAGRFLTIWTIRDHLKAYTLQRDKLSQCIITNIIIVSIIIVGNITLAKLINVFQNEWASRLVVDINGDDQSWYCSHHV